MTKTPLPRARNGTPRLRYTSDVVAYWAERIEQRNPEQERFEKSSMICRGDSLFHYGTHFELARILRTKRGDARLVLLNGDEYRGSGGFGPSTASRQWEARSAVARSSVDGLVIPFSALDSAGIDFASIVAIDVRPDRHTDEQRESTTPPTRKLSTMDDPSGATHQFGEVEVPVRVPNPNRTAPFRRNHGWSDGATRGGGGVWRWTERRHWLGDCVFRAKLTEARTRKATDEELSAAEQYRAWVAESRRLGDLVNTLPRTWQRADGRSEGRYDYRRMFRLAMAREGLGQAQNRLYDTAVPPSRVRDGRMPTTVTRWATFVSSFDYQEPRPLYFLAELPYGAKPRTVDEAIESLKPPEVLAAIARGLPVLRQGDVFAIPTKLDRRQLRRLRKGDFTKRLRVLDTNHSVTEGIICRGGATLGRGIMRHEPEAWRAPDHVDKRLGDRKTWHLLIRNTVPRSH